MEDLLSVDSSYVAGQIASFPIASNLIMLIQFGKTANSICQLKWQVKSALEPKTGDYLRVHSMKLLEVFLFPSGRDTIPIYTRGWREAL